MNATTTTVTSTPFTDIGSINEVAGTPCTPGWSPPPGPGPSLPYTPPLDDFANAEVGYSVRKISSSYTGSCLEAYRTSDGATQDIGFDDNGLISETELAAFYDGSLIRVSKWYDQAGSNNDMVQATPADMPRIYDDQTSLWIDGGTTVFRLKYAGLNSQDPVNESFTVYNPAPNSQVRMDLTNPISTGPTFSVAIISNGGSTSSNVWGNVGGQTWLTRITFDRYNTGSGQWNYPTPTTNAQNSLFVNDADTPVAQIRVNGMEDSSSVTPKTTGTIPNFHIWDSQFVTQQNASISEIILFNDTKWSDRVALTAQQGDYFQI